MREGFGTPDQKSINTEAISRAVIHQNPEELLRTGPFGEDLGGEGFWEGAGEVIRQEVCDRGRTFRLGEQASILQKSMEKERLQSVSVRPGGCERFAEKLRSGNSDQGASRRPTHF